MMNLQNYFEEIEEGMDIPGFDFGPITMEHLLRWACARGNYHPIHFDKDLAQSEGHPDVLVHGPLKLGLMDRMIRNWIGENGQLKKISATYKAIDLPGDILTCKGKVLRKNEEDGKGYVFCELWVENQEGKVTTKGEALAVFPFKG